MSKIKNMFQIDDENMQFRANIKVIGVGGGGCNAIKTMYESGLSGVEFIAANTDLQTLEELDLKNKIQLGVQLTKGLGAGANPEIGRKSAIESCEIISEKLSSTDMVFVTAGMGGGTGTGAAGVIAGIAKKQGILTVGVVTRPFFFEGQRRARHAETGIQFLKENVDTLIVIPNQKLFKAVDESASLLSAFKSVDEILLKAVKSIADLVNKKGLINLDFSDIKTIMSEKGLALIGTGDAEGEKRALTAGHIAVSSPLLEDSSFKGARGVIINITGGLDLSLAEVDQTAQMITNEAHPDAEIIFGAVIDPKKTDGRVQVTVIATGFTSQEPEQKETKNFSHKLSSKSSKDILLEKAKTYQVQKKISSTKQQSTNSTHSSEGQLSMKDLENISEQKDETKSIGYNLPFNNSHKKKTFLMEFFKKSTTHTLADKEG